MVSRVIKKIVKEEARACTAQYFKQSKTDENP